MERFCGESPVLDSSLLANNTWPEFSPCFHHTVLVWVPCGFLWLTLPVFLKHLFGLKQHLPLSELTITKLVVIAVLIACVIGDVIRASIGETGNFPVSAAFYLAAMMKILSYVLSLYLTVISRRRGLTSPCVLCIFWILNLLANVIPFYSLIIQRNDRSLAELGLFYIYYGGLVTLIILLSFPEKVDDVIDPSSTRAPCPGNKASFISKVTFSWTFKTLWRGWRETLKAEDICDLPPPLKCEVTVPPFLKSWSREERRVARLNNANGQRRDAQELQSLLEQPESDQSANGKKILPDIIVKDKASSCSHPNQPKKPSLVRTILRAYTLDILKVHCYRIVAECIYVMNPVILKILIQYIDHRDTEPSWKGYAIIAAFALTRILDSVTISMSYFSAENLSIKVRTALTQAIYKKSLTMNTESRKKYSTGEIVNLMSVDVLRVEQAIVNMWLISASPILFFACFYQLHQVMGLSFLAGLIIILGLTPLLSVLFLKYRAMFNEQLKYKDERLKHMGELLNAIKVRVKDERLKHMGELLNAIKVRVKDERLKHMGELLNAIKVLKLYAWEGSFRDKVMAVREKEVKVIWKIAVIVSVLIFAYVGAPTLVTVACFVTYVMTSPNKYLDSETAFVSLTLFSYLKIPMNLLPMSISVLVQSSVSIKRLDDYLAGSDLDPNTVSSITAEGTAINIDRATFTWGTDTEPTLKNVSLSVPAGKLVAVVGSVGAGKSSLLSAMLGEMLKVKGHVAVKGKIGYVPQEAWIQNLSLKMNMLFGCDMDSGKYQDVVNACALVSDISVLPGGVNTEIGEKGINLSGGQKQRVSLARAVYSDRDVYLMDDPLSAVDSHVGKHIFRHVIGNQGLLKEKTRILVTHGVHWLPMVDVIVVLEQGEITEVGSYEELLRHDGPFAQFLKTYLFQHNADEDSGDEERTNDSTEIRTSIQERVDSVTSLHVSPVMSNTLTSSEDISASPSGLRHRHSTTCLSGSLSSVVREADGDIDLDFDLEPRDVDEEETRKEHKLVNEEYTEVGKVKFTVWKSYLSALGWLAALVILGLLVFYNFAWVMSSIWLSVWTEDSRLKFMTQENMHLEDTINRLTNSTTGFGSGRVQTTTSSFDYRTLDGSNKSVRSLGHNVTEESVTDLESLSYYYLGVFGTVACLQAIGVLVNLLYINIKMVKAARIMHEKLLDNIIKQPMSFFDTTPTGRILNRFTRDVDVVDSQIPRILRHFLEHLFNLISILIIIAYSTPLFLAVAVPITLLYIFIQRMYTPTSRQLRRYFSSSKSPVYSHFTETINGATSVRAYRAQERFIRSSMMRVNENNVFYYGAVTTHRWMKIRMDALLCIVVISATLLGLLTPGISSGVLGLSISHALQITGSLILVVVFTTELETNVVSVERMAEYSNLRTEADWIVPDHRPPKDWPTSGHIKFDNLKIRYRPELDLVLKGITCEIKPGEKIGVVGRTGAGKSSLTLALFRILEASEGRILIDGHNIADIGLHDLRSKLTILPQDPVLFSGTLRLNLDPFEEHSDEDLWLALERAHLKEFVSGLGGGLHHHCEEGGHNLSVGQRQLVCLARSLLRKTRILVLDEATAAVDMETDELIQKTIRSAFHDCTVVTIAHRLNTIMDYDRILVLSAGEIAEFDTPDKLLEDTNSMFYSLAKDANIVN